MMADEFGRLQHGAANTGVTLWQMVQTREPICGIAPQTASWDKKGHPKQVALQTYLDDLQTQIGDLPDAEQLALHLDIDIAAIPFPGDIDNYLWPIIHLFNWRRFVLASGRKRQRGGSQLRIGTAARAGDAGHLEGWHRIGHRAPNKTNWKHQLHDSVRRQTHAPAPPGGVDVIAVWTCSPSINWADPLWKETIDTLGPVLGESSPFHPFDDRIVSLELHRNIDKSRLWEVDVDIWWRPSQRGN